LTSPNKTTGDLAALGSDLVLTAIS